MKLHVRLSGNRYSFRLRLFDKYVDAGDSYDSEESAAFAADLTKHYLRTFFYIKKNTEASLDGEHFCTLSYRHNVTLSDRGSVESKLAPGVVSFIAENRAALDAYAEANRGSLRDWEKLRGYDNAAVREWVHRCDAAEILAAEYATVSSDSFFTRLSVVDRSLDASLKSLALAVRLHGDQPPASLAPRVAEVSQLIKHLTETQSTVRNLTARLKNEQSNAESALTALEANRPPLT